MHTRCHNFVVATGHGAHVHGQGFKIIKKAVVGQRLFGFKPLLSAFFLIQAGKALLPAHAEELARVRHGADRISLFPGFYVVFFPGCGHA